MDDATLRRLHEDVMERMLHGGWITSYKSGTGYHLKWTRHGAEASTILKGWHHRLRIGVDDFRPYLALVLVYGLRLHPDSNPDIHTALAPYVESGLAAAASFSADAGLKVGWTPAGLAFCAAMRGLLDELNLPPDEDIAWALFSIIVDWTPVPGTPTVSRN
jgi:hypothetical protein